MDICRANIFADAHIICTQNKSFLADTTWWSWSKSWTRLTVWVAACWLTGIFVLNQNLVFTALSFSCTLVKRCAHSVISYESSVTDAAFEANLWTSEIGWIWILAGVFASSITLGENFIVATEFRTFLELNALVVVVSDESYLAETSGFALSDFAVDERNLTTCVSAARAALCELLVLTRASCC
jgi:hypothetical protein